MKEKSYLVQIRPRSFLQWRALPILGPLLDDFVQWMQDQDDVKGTILNYLKIVPQVVGWLQRHRITTLGQLTQQDLQVARDHYHSKQDDPSWVIAALKRFVNERHLVPLGVVPEASPVEVQVADFKEYLRETRGLAEATIQGQVGVLRSFLTFLRFNQDPERLPKLQLRQIETFLHPAARTNNRFSLQHIVATLRAYLRQQYAQGRLPQPLHQQIDIPHGPIEASNCRGRWLGIRCRHSCDPLTVPNRLDSVTSRCSIWRQPMAYAMENWCG
jgi:site-specific recombinase XerD